MNGSFNTPIPRSDHPGLWQSQTWTSAPRPVTGYGKGGTMIVAMRFDDECGNGHNTFSITADVYTDASRRRHDIAAAGCMHDEIARVFPELAPLILWHLCATDGPMHYPGNAIYNASNRDCYGLLKDEVQQLRNSKSGELAWILKGTATRYADGPEPPTDTPPAQQWEPWTRTGEGKERQLAFARSSACWPDATDEQLCAEPAVLQAALDARLPQLLVDFRAAIEGAGFAWSPAA
jgi:hypothetical protein